MKLSGTDLLPGDVVSIGRSSGQNGEDKSVPADMLILAGSAIVNEAILTGESTPQWKVVLSFFSLIYIFIGHLLFPGVTCTNKLFFLGFGYMILDIFNLFTFLGRKVK